MKKTHDLLLKMTMKNLNFEFNIMREVVNFSFNKYNYYAIALIKANCIYYIIYKKTNLLELLTIYTSFCMICMRKL